MRSFAAGGTRLAVLGHAPGTAAGSPDAAPDRVDGAPRNQAAAGEGPAAQTVRRCLARVRDTGDLADVDQVAALMRGSCHVAVTAHGRYRLQGTASGLRRVFWARWRGIAVAADRADILARLTGAALDERYLALALLVPGPPAPADDLTPWRGVEAVPPGSALTVSASGPPGVRRWWQPPPADVSLVTGAQFLREALREAVAERVGREDAAGRRVGCDLSGGLDSTSLAFLARDRGPVPVTLTVTYEDTANDDPYWAAIAREHLHPQQGRAPDEAVALDIAGASLPGQYTGLEARATADAAAPLLRGRADLEFLAATYLRHGASVQLAGHGGDEVLQAPPGYLHGLVRRRPLTALRHLRGHRARRRWLQGAALHALADTRSYPQWLAGEAARLKNTEPARGPFGWGEPLALAPWATPAARDLAADTLHEAARTAAPLVPDRGQHATLHRVHTAARLYRHLRQEHPQPWIALPFLDDRVLDSCLAVRLEERGTPFAYKPLLKAGLRGILPEEFHSRATKGAGTATVYQALREQRAKLSALADHSVLAERGLIDPVGLRQALSAPGPRTDVHLENTLACEHWLRSTTTPGPAFLERP
ncbi:asparagine synthase-related protein [Streptomyces sp. NPDC003077]|uniref:asparagine synthase-related protein n=1 Tax=Streptomyces sp. NPDC003077 TaxID=3154443 RepID=UPI0033AF56B0